MNAPSHPLADDSWTVAGRVFRSRLIVGTGKYKDYAVNAAAAEAAGAEIVTVALRRVNLSDPSQPMLVDFVRPDRFTYLPNTAGCFTGEEAVRTLRLAREAGGWDLVKLEVLSNTKHLLPDMEETLRALKLLVAALGLDRRKLAVERNLEIVPRSLFAATPLADGDRIEIVHFIGGG